MSDSEMNPPHFWDEKVWEKIPLIENGLRDLVGCINDFGFHFHDENFGSLLPEERLGIGQEYRKIDDEEQRCMVITFFDQDEPCYLLWIETPSQEIPNLAIKKDGVWITVRPPEILLADCSGVSSTLIDGECRHFTKYTEVKFTLWNHITNQIVLELIIRNDSA